MDILNIGQIMLLAVLFSFGESRLKERKTVDDYLNMCLKGRNHKEKPGPESHLYMQCAPWKSRSCCTKEVSDGINTQKNWLNFNWDHCKELSLQCRQHFIQDLCFYECSPNVGPWLVEDVRKIRKERYEGVPLCQSDCQQWWDACKDEFTCVENWAEHFNWSTGINKCPGGSECRPFHEIYDGPQHFCENLFGPSFKVVKDAPETCFYMWFDPDRPNPNEAVARKEIDRLLNNNNVSVVFYLHPLFLVLIFAACWIMW